VDSRFHGNDGDAKHSSLYNNLTPFYECKILNLMAIELPLRIENRYNAQSLKLATVLFLQFCKNKDRD